MPTVKLAQLFKCNASIERLDFTVRNTFQFTNKSQDLYLNGIISMMPFVNLRYASHAVAWQFSYRIVEPL